MNVITVAAAVILNTDNQLLLVRKKNTEAFMQVGGKLEPNELPEATMLREIEEEIGTTSRIQSFIGRFETATANEPDHRLVAYLYHVVLDHDPQIHAEIAEMRWVDLDQQQDDRLLNLAPLTTEIVMPWVKTYLASAAATQTA